MTQASVLKVTANGTTTSPVLRGVWIMERILGLFTPPRRRRARPRARHPRRGDHPPATRETSREPHLRLLPPQDRSSGVRARKLRRYGRLARPLSRLCRECEAEPGHWLLRGQPFAFHYGLPVDSAGTLTDGRRFKDIREFKRLLLDHEERTVARNLARQLDIFATGAPVGFSDREQVEEILDKTRARGYGVATLSTGSSRAAFSGTNRKDGMSQSNSIAPFARA